jgi:hypothetical protein
MLEVNSQENRYNPRDENQNIVCTMRVFTGK